jgi:hypothetical protein
MADNTKDKLIIFQFRMLLLVLTIKVIFSQVVPKTNYMIYQKQYGSKQSNPNFVGQANYQQATGGATSTSVKATKGSLLIVKPSYNFNIPTF